jgi:hypothetical protein
MVDGTPARVWFDPARSVDVTGESLPVEGVVDLNSALERDPNNQIALLGPGASMLISDQFDRAIIVFNQIIGKFTDDTNARLLRTSLSGAEGHPECDVRCRLCLQHPARRPRTADGSRAIWSAMQDYPKAIDDLTQAVAKRETVENYIARGRPMRRGTMPRALHPTSAMRDRAPRSVFDVLAQAAVKQKVDQFSKKIPCGNSAGSYSEKTCL